MITLLGIAGWAPVALLIKPQTALPFLAVYPIRRWAVFVAAGVLAASVLIMPSWPAVWLGKLGPYRGEALLMSWPGLLVLLAVPHWKRPGARLLILMACCPTRGLYDMLPLWLVSEKRNGIVVLSILHWVAVLGLLLLGFGGGCKGPGYKTAVSSPKLTAARSAKLTAPGSAKLTT